MNEGQYHELDLSSVLIQAYELGDSINCSAEVADYLYWKQRKEEDPKLKELLYEFNRKKQLFEECQRFGHFHPDYHAAMDSMQAAQAALDTLESVSRFKQAEDQLDELLYSISRLVAHSVSDTIKVPSNNPLPETGCASGGCGSGGGCNCG